MFCLDMPKFGGKGARKQCCLQRICNKLSDKCKFIQKSFFLLILSLSLDDYSGTQNSKFLFQQQSYKSITQYVNLVYNNNGRQKMLCSTNDVVSILNGCSVTRDLKTLNGRNWLTDKVINFINKQLLFNLFHFRSLTSTYF